MSLKLALDALTAVLCDPQGDVVIQGSDEDRQTIAEALALIEAMLPAKVEVSPLASSSELFNALMAAYGNPIRATPHLSITSTLKEACEAAGIWEEGDPATAKKRILLS